MKNCIRIKLLALLIVVFTALPANADEYFPIGVSYNEVTKHLDRAIPISRTTDISGLPRYMGQTASGTAVLEVIGEKEDISQATFIFGAPVDAPKISMANAIMAVRLIKNVFPKWEGAVEWLSEALAAAMETKQKQDIIRENKRISLSLVPMFGSAILTISSEQAN